MKKIMNFIFYFIAILSIAITQPCHAMNNTTKEPAHIISTINTMTNPQNIIYFEKNIAAIASTDECSIYDIPNNKKIHTLIHNPFIKKIVGHPHKPLLATLTLQPNDIRSLAIYNVKTQNKIAELSKKKIFYNPFNEYETNEYEALEKPFAFNPNNDTIIIRYKPDTLCIFNYETHKKTYYALNYKLCSIYSEIVFNPNKNECLINTRKTTADPTEIIVIDTSDESSLSCNEIFSTRNFINTLHYNKDSSQILLTHAFGYDILRAVSNKEKSKIIWTKNFDIKYDQIMCNAITQNANDIFAILSIKNKCIYYRDIYNNIPIASTQISVNPQKYDYYFPSILQFITANKLIVLVDRRCHVLQIPFNMQY